MVTAAFYDGRSSARHAVSLRVAGDTLLIEGGALCHRVPLRAVRFGEPLGRGPRCIELPEGAHCEVADHPGLERLIAAAGGSDGLVVRLQRRWRWAAASLALIVGSALAAYFWGLPAAAKALAPHVPPAAVKALSSGVFSQLDRQLFTPSRLSPERQAAIRVLAERSFASDRLPPWRIHFRRSQHLGANAVALPAGDIVILDGLATLLADDRQVVAVIAHEIGHLAHHHAMRHLIEGATVSLVMAAWIGDVSSAAVALGAQLAQSGYSREAEREADAFAVTLLTHCCDTPEPLAAALDQLVSGGEAGGGLRSLLDTHPETAERIRAIRAGRATGTAN